jgi:hypothetical protein
MTSDPSVTFSWAATPEPAHHATEATAATARNALRIAPTILQALLTLLLVAVATSAVAQSAPPDDPFTPRRWHVEGDLQASFEAWNYNGSHEEVYGLTEGASYGVSHRVAFILSQRVFYVSQRGNDTWLLGLTFGFRVRVYQRGRVHGFLEGDIGITDASIAAPPRGTRFNYVGIGSGGVLVRVRPRTHVLVGLQLLHISNASLKGPGRNPDIEAIGPKIGIVLGF